MSAHDAALPRAGENLDQWAAREVPKHTTLMPLGTATVGVYADSQLMGDGEPRVLQISRLGLVLEKFPSSGTTPRLWNFRDGTLKDVYNPVSGEGWKRPIPQNAGNPTRTYADKIAAVARKFGMI